MKALWALARILHKLRYVLTVVQVVLTGWVSLSIGGALFSGMFTLAIIKVFYWIISGIRSWNSTSIQGSTMNQQEQQWAKAHYEHDLHPKIAEEPKKQFYCLSCGGTNLVSDAATRWNIDKQEWVVASVYDDTYCEDCEQDVRVEFR